MKENPIPPVHRYLIDEDYHTLAILADEETQRQGRSFNPEQMRVYEQWVSRIRPRTIHSLLAHIRWLESRLDAAQNDARSYCKSWLALVTKRPTFQLGHSSVIKLETEFEALGLTKEQTYKALALVTKTIHKQQRDTVHGKVEGPRGAGDAGSDRSGIGSQYPGTPAESPVEVQGTPAPKAD